MYVGNNPIRRVDVEGKDWKDKVAGLVRGTYDNVFGTTTRSSYIANNPDHYDQALAIADAASLYVGVQMIVNAPTIGAAAGALVSGAAVVTSEGTAITVAPEIAAATAATVTTGVAAGGAWLVHNAAKNIKDNANSSNNGGNNEKKTNPKKEAREKAKEIRDNQPASEKYAKDKAKAKGKAEGADARRKAHDAKDKIGKDRTKKEIDEDYKINNK